MKVEIKVLINDKEIEENRFLRQRIIEHNHFHPYSQKELPEFTKKIYQTTHFSFKVVNVVNFHIDTNPEKDLIINLAGYGVIAAVYNPLVENKLEVIFNGE